MSQIRRTCTSSDRKPVLSWSSDRTGTPENGETEVKEDKGDASGTAKKDVNENTSGPSKTENVRLYFSRRRGRARRRLGKSLRLPAEAGTEGGQQEAQPGPL